MVVMNFQEPQFAVRMTNGNGFKISIFSAPHSLDQLRNRSLNGFRNDNDADQHKHHIDEKNPEGYMKQGGAECGLVF